jgi:hypothetical protein
MFKIKNFHLYQWTIQIETQYELEKLHPIWLRIKFIEGNDDTWLKICDNSKFRKRDKALSTCLQAIRVSILTYNHKSNKTLH